MGEQSRAQILKHLLSRLHEFLLHPGVALKEMFLKQSVKMRLKEKEQEF